MKMQQSEWGSQAHPLSRTRSNTGKQISSMLATSLRAMGDNRTACSCDRSQGLYALVASREESSACAARQLPQLWHLQLSLSLLRSMESSGKEPSASPERGEGRRALPRMSLTFALYLLCSQALLRRAERECLQRACLEKKGLALPRWHWD